VLEASRTSSRATFPLTYAGLSVAGRSRFGAGRRKTADGGGDAGRQGNNVFKKNGYCQDNEDSWMIGEHLDEGPGWNFRRGGMIISSSAAGPPGSSKLGRGLVPGDGGLKGQAT